MKAIGITAFVLAGWIAATSWATPTVPPAPVVDTSTLPALAPDWAVTNPYRSNANAAGIGRDAFNQACARCHGVDANGSGAAAPDLRRLGLACGRVRDDALKQRCLADVDHYFVQSVLKGKTRFGIEHMPAWEGVLEPNLIWSLKSFIETQARR